MSAIHEELRHLVDRLTDEQAGAVRSVVLHLVAGDPGHTAAGPEGTRRRSLSFVGMIEAEPDLAERSQRILRDELGQSPS